MNKQIIFPKTDKYEIVYLTALLKEHTEQSIKVRLEQCADNIMYRPISGSNIELKKDESYTWRVIKTPCTKEIRLITELENMSSNPVIDFQLVIQ